MLINSNETQGNSSELNHVAQVINEEPKVFIFKVQDESI